MDSSFKNLLSPIGASKARSAKKATVHSPFRTPSRTNTTGRLNQSNSQVFLKTPGYVVEQFGSQLPVLITEALKFSDGVSAVSVNISNDGWAWFVCGRRLLVWQATGSGPVTQCRELSLPPSDLAHRAHLVTVYTQQPLQMPCCLAVSPEGIVRYWSSIAHESSWTEVNAELQGQECDSLHLLLPLGALLVTTTATLVLVTPHFAAARHTLLCRTIKTPHGWLGGISRRMSSLIFGSIPATQIMETKLVKVVTWDKRGGEWTVIVLAGHTLQKWQLCNGEMEVLLLEADLARPLREAFVERNHNIQELVLLDMQALDDKVMLLVAGFHDASHLTYALVTVQTESAPLSLSWFRELTSDDLGPLSHTSHADSSLQFLVINQVALVYNSSHIVAIPVSGNENVELLDFGCGQIVGGARYRQTPLFFTTFNGFISVTSTEDQHNESCLLMSEAIPDPLISETNIEELTQSNDSVGLLKASFLLYIKNQMAQSKAAIANLFEGGANNVSTSLDNAVLQTSMELINDVPSKDPRWADQKSSSRPSVGSSNSLQIVHQLEEKQRVLQWFASFLKELHLWEKLGTVTHGNRSISTTFVLQEHAEKVAATLAMKKAHTKHVKLVDKIIEEVLMKHHKTPFGSLTNQDLFYRQVSLAHEAIQQLVKWSEDVVFTEQNSQLVASQLISANNLLLDMLRAVNVLQDQIGSTYQPARVVVAERKLWTCAGGPESIADSLLLQMQLTLKHGVQSAGDPQLRAELLDQLLSLVDFVLDSRKSHVESLRDTSKFSTVLHQYESDRLSYIQMFTEESEYERAAILAEKYLDFQVLIDICEKTNNKERLDSYINKFHNQGFSNFLFTWYLREQKQSDLLQHCTEKGGEHLVPLLSEHPTLSWLHDLSQQQYKQAGQTLTSLAKAEEQLLQRKKTQLSLAKLSLLASSDPSADTEELTSQLQLIAFQEHLPASLLTHYGYDTENMRLFSPTQLIKLYISDENSERTEFMFKTALDILSYVDDNQEKSELSNEIWSKAVLQDEWVDRDPNSPLSSIQTLFFFKLLDLCIFEGCEDMVPSIEDLLTCEALGTLKENNTFQYLLQVGYEHFNKDVVMSTL